MEKDKKKFEEPEKVENKASEKTEEGHEKDENGKESFEQEREAYIAEKLEFEAARELTAEGMPVSFAKILAGKDSDETKENVAIFKKEFMKALEEALSKRLKGNVPKTGSVDMQVNDPFLAGFGM